MPPTDKPFGQALAMLLIGLLLLSGLNISAKYLGEFYSSQQVAMMRNLFGLIPALLILQWKNPIKLSVSTFIFPRWYMACLRGLLITFAQFLFFWALTEMPLASARSLSYIGPVFTTLLTAVILQEKVGIWRWSAVLSGFVGVLLVLDPFQTELETHHFLPLASSIIVALALILMRQFDKSTSHAAINLVTTLTALVGSLLLVFFTAEFDWPDTQFHWFVAVMSGLLGGAGVFLMSWAYRHANPAKLAPFQYCGLFYALFFGWLWFDELPLETIFPGIIFIAAAGVVIAWRESVLGKRNSDQRIQEKS